MRPKLHSINSLAIELAIDRRTVSKRLSGVAPDGKLGGHDAWLLATAWPALLTSERATGNGTTEDERRRLTAAQADLAELRLERERGTLIDARAVERGWQTIIVTIRDAFRMLPMGCVDRLMAAVEDGRPALKQALQEEIDDTLRRVAAMKIDLSDLDDDDDDDESDDDADTAA